MIADFLKRTGDVMAPQIAELGGLWMPATDRNEALALAIRNLSAKWLCIGWVSDGDGSAEGSDLSRRGFTTAVLNIAIAKRPQLDRDRTAKALADDDSSSLLNLWQRVRGLVYRIRFGSLTEADEPGSAYFTPADGYLDGTEPMQLGKWNIGREVYEITEPNGTTKGMKELLWAQSAWTARLALPGIPAACDNLQQWWLCA